MCVRAGSAAGSLGPARPRTSRRALLSHYAQPGGTSLLALIDRELHLGHRLDAAGNTLAALVCLDPHAAHVRLDLAIAVRPHPPAGPVAQLLRAIHRAGHAG